MSLTLGIDTGGTYTDAVLLDGARRVRASAKALTTHEDLAQGIGAALEAVLIHADGPIRMVSLSTTLATNAVVEGEGQRVALLLIGQGREALDRGGLGPALGRDFVRFLPGGHDGSGAEREPLDPAATMAAIEEYAPRVAAFALSAHFAVRNPAHERRVADLIGERTDRPVSCGHHLSGALDAPRRALTALLNARLIPLLTELIGAVRGLLARHGIAAPLMVVRGDGSLVSADFALAAPVETILSGPAASLVGARHLAAEPDAVVFDMGGTTSDIGMLEGGEPRRHREGAIVGGWRTRVDAVDVRTCGLGGDSEVHVAHAPALTVGPRRVMPLAQLVARYPHLLAVLEEQIEALLLSQHAGRFAFRRREPAGGAEALSRSQRALWDRLAEGPLDLARVFEDHTRQRPFDRLVDQGVVGVAGFTPTDAAHILGSHVPWSVAAARCGARILIRRAWNRWSRDLGTPEALSRAVADAVTEAGARYTFAAALAGTDAAPDGSMLAGAAALVDAAIGAAPALPVVEAGLRLRWPLVVIGAPAGAYGESMARRLGTRLVRPAHGEVANAVGAVIAGVTQRVTATITPLPDERYRVHGAQGISTFTTLDEAGEWAEAEAERSARAHAAAAGAVDVRVELQRHDTVGHTEDGFELFFEATITATARGRPAGADDSDEIPAGLSDVEEGHHG